MKIKYKLNGGMSVEKDKISVELSKDKKIDIEDFLKQYDIKLNDVKGNTKVTLDEALKKVKNYRDPSDFIKLLKLVIEQDDVKNQKLVNENTRLKRIIKELEEEQEEQEVDDKSTEKESLVNKNTYLTDDTSNNIHIISFVINEIDKAKFTMNHVDNDTKKKISEYLIYLIKHYLDIDESVIIKHQNKFKNTLNVNEFITGLKEEILNLIDNLNINDTINNFNLTISNESNTAESPHNYNPTLTRSRLDNTSFESDYEEEEEEKYAYIYLTVINNCIEYGIKTSNKISQQKSNNNDIQYHKICSDISIPSIITITKKYSELNIENFMLDLSNNRESNILEKFYHEISNILDIYVVDDVEKVILGNNDDYNNESKLDSISRGISSYILNFKQMVRGYPEGVKDISKYSDKGYSFSSKALNTLKNNIADFDNEINKVTSFIKAMKNNKLSYDIHKYPVYMKIFIKANKRCESLNRYFKVNTECFLLLNNIQKLYVYLKRSNTKLNIDTILNNKKNYEFNTLFRNIQTILKNKDSRVKIHECFNYIDELKAFFMDNNVRNAIIILKYALSSNNKYNNLNYIRELFTIDGKINDRIIELIDNYYNIICDCSLKYWDTKQTIDCLSKIFTTIFDNKNLINELKKYKNQCILDKKVYFKYNYENILFIFNSEIVYILNLIENKRLENKSLTGSDIKINNTFDLYNILKDFDNYNHMYNIYNHMYDYKYYTYGYIDDVCDCLNRLMMKYDGFKNLLINEYNDTYNACKIYTELNTMGHDKYFNIYIIKSLYKKYLNYNIINTILDNIKDLSSNLEEYYNDDNKYLTYFKENEIKDVILNIEEILIKNFLTTLYSLCFYYMNYISEVWFVFDKLEYKDISGGANYKLQRKDIKDMNEINSNLLNVNQNYMFSDDSFVNGSEFDFSELDVSDDSFVNNRTLDDILNRYDETIINKFISFDNELIKLLYELTSKLINNIVINDLLDFYNAIMKYITFLKRIDYIKYIKYIDNLYSNVFNFLRKYTINHESKLDEIDNTLNKLCEIVYITFNRFAQLKTFSYNELNDIINSILHYLSDITYNIIDKFKMANDDIPKLTKTDNSTVPFFDTEKRTFIELVECKKVYTKFDVLNFCNSLNQLKLFLIKTSPKQKDALKVLPYILEMVIQIYNIDDGVKKYNQKNYKESESEIIIPDLNNLPELVDKNLKCYFKFSLYLSFNYKISGGVHKRLTFDFINTIIKEFYINAYDEFTDNINKKNDSNEILQNMLKKIPINEMLLLEEHKKTLEHLITLYRTNIDLYPINYVKYLFNICLGLILNYVNFNDMFHNKYVDAYSELNDNIFKKNTLYNIMNKYILTKKITIYKNNLIEYLTLLNDVCNILFNFNFNSFTKNKEEYLNNINKVFIENDYAKNIVIDIKICTSILNDEKHEYFKKTIVNILVMKIRVLYYVATIIKKIDRKLLNRYISDYISTISNKNEVEINALKNGFSKIIKIYDLINDLNFDDTIYSNPYNIFDVKVHVRIEHISNFVDKMLEIIKHLPTTETKCISKKYTLHNQDVTLDDNLIQYIINVSSFSIFSLLIVSPFEKINIQLDDSFTLLEKIANVESLFKGGNTLNSSSIINSLNNKIIYNSIMNISIPYEKQKIIHKGGNEISVKLKKELHRNITITSFITTLLFFVLSLILISILVYMVYQWFNERIVKDENALKNNKGLNFIIPSFIHNRQNTNSKKYA